MSESMPNSVTCYACNGSGEVFTGNYVAHVKQYKKCKVCNGSGDHNNTRSNLIALKAFCPKCANKTTTKRYRISNIHKVNMVCAKCGCGWNMEIKDTEGGEKYF